MRPQVRPSKRSTICILGIVIVFIFGAYIDGHAMSDKSFFENTYSYPTRNMCRSIGTQYGFKYAIQCARLVEENNRREENRQAQLDLTRSLTLLVEQITRDRRRR